MPIYALLVDNMFREVRTRDTKPDDIPHKNVTWHDVATDQQPAYDSVTHHTPVRIEGLVNGVWRFGWLAAVAKTQAEIDARIQARQDDAIVQLQRPDAVELVLAEALFEVLNEVRILKEQTKLTKAQFVNWLRGKF